MNRALLLAPLLLVACREVAGIHPIAYEAGSTGDGGGGGGCTNATAILTSTSGLDSLAIAGGYALAAIESSSTAAATNVVACPVNAPCTNPPGLLNLAFSDTLESYAASNQIYYAVQTGTAGAGAIHSLSFDGKTDTVLLPSASYPMFITASGSRVFWTSDDGTNPATLHCTGCSAGDQVWMSNLGVTGGVFSDANNVYVIADDGTNNGTDAIFYCSINAACGAASKPLITGLAFTATNIAPEVTSDGSNVYVSNDTSGIIRVPIAGTQTDVAKGVAAEAIAVDPATGDLFYGKDDGTIVKAKSDGSSMTPTTLATCAPNDPGSIFGISYDANNVYVLVVPASGASGIWAIKRN